MSVTIGLRSLYGFAAGIIVAAIAVFMFQALRADAIGADETTFVPIAPCRLLDTRPAPDNIGTRNVPLSENTPYSLQVTGTNGECTIPPDATGVAINLTGVEPTAATFVTIYPDDVANPGTSALNMLPGQSPSPNKVDIKLSPDGKVKLFNRFGTIHIVGDVLGYYRSDGLTDLEARLVAIEADNTNLQADVTAVETANTNLQADVTAIETANTNLQADVMALETANTNLQADVTALETANTNLQTAVAALESKTASMSMETVDGQPTVRFSNVNVQIVDGSGDTAGGVNGKGNLIVGYNENVFDTRTGSHNLIVGRNHSYSSYGGFVAGYGNAVTGAYSSVPGGDDNIASGRYSSVSGGWSNTASAPYSSVSGGFSNTASGHQSSVSGGSQNSASAIRSSVSGGSQNSASASFSSVSGGTRNTASGMESSVSGGADRAAIGQFDWVAGFYFSEF